MAIRSSQELAFWSSPRKHPHPISHLSMMRINLNKKKWLNIDLRWREISELNMNDKEVLGGFHKCWSKLVLPLRLVHWSILADNLYFWNIRRRILTNFIQKTKIHIIVLVKLYFTINAIDNFINKVDMYHCIITILFYNDCLDFCHKVVEAKRKSLYFTGVRM